ncbi:MAG TPA: helix-turn-helix domain-containing protein [Providencia sp.]|uniref:winged helix-turn-helix domain-containing protein n=1 Tax=unclassified Providencia TaxID=2633465 RepID=UPI000E965643|nr:helix-turn-helix domain-containing protein [Providencia sp.]MBP6081178.1 winged helix-turn-helix domain-containing protein [Providencia sp.]HBO21394.1 helix-turn-helix domain-containing protein [Providencia sp.]
MIEEHDYTIDNKFVFEQKTSRIYLKDDQNQNIELSKPAARLFNEIILLNMKKGIATRDELLTNVWEEYGLVGSNNNLNTYISEIRKKLEIVGIDPKSIVTVPKKGFRIDSHLSKFEMEDSDNTILCEEFNTQHDDKLDFYDNLPPPPLLKAETPPVHLLIEPETHNAEQNPTEQKIIENQSIKIKNASHESIENDNIFSDDKQHVIINSNKKKIARALLLSFSIIVILTSIYMLFDSPVEDNIVGKSYLTVSKRDNCIIQTPTDMVGKTTSDNINFVNKKLEKYNISCDEPKRVIILSDLNYTYSFDKNIAISICKEKNNKYDCVSINDQRI